MTRASRFDSARAMLLDAWRNRGVSVKALSFAMIGVVNTLVDYGVFLLARAVLSGSSAGLFAIGSLNDFCQCSDATTTTLVVANLISWSIAVTGSYIMNSAIALERLFDLRGLRRCRIARQHRDASVRRGNSAVAGVAGESGRNSGELSRQLLDFALCRLPVARRGGRYAQG
jgi:hypothetical protein